MKKTVLIFADLINLTDFVYENVIQRARIDAGLLCLKAELTDQEIETACFEYGAIEYHTLVLILE